MSIKTRIRNLSKQEIKDIFDIATHKYGAKWWIKNKSFFNKQPTKTLMKAFWKVFNNNISQDEFIKNYSTTIGNTIYFCFVPGSDSLSYETQLSILAHELMHVEQYKRLGLRFFTQYLFSSEKRAFLEAEAFSVNLEMLIYIEKRMIMQGDINRVLNKLKKYGCNEQDLTLAETFLVSRLDYAMQFHKRKKLLSPQLETIVGLINAR